jgi:hypothetical protein
MGRGESPCTPCHAIPMARRLIVKGDRQGPLVVLPLKLAAEIAARFRDRPDPRRLNGRAKSASVLPHKRVDVESSPRAGAPCEICTI